MTLAPVGSGGRADAVERLAGSQTLQDTLGAEGWTVGQIPAATGLPDPGRSACTQRTERMTQQSITTPSPLVISNF